MIGLHALLETLGQLVVVGLQLVVELNKVHNILEVLHEFLVVDSAVAIDVSQQVY